MAPFIVICTFHAPRRNAPETALLYMRHVTRTKTPPGVAAAMAVGWGLVKYNGDLLPTTP